MEGDDQGAVRPEGAPGAHRAGGPPRRQLRERDLRAHRHGASVVRRGVRADADGRRPPGAGGVRPLGDAVDPRRIPETALEQVRAVPGVAPRRGLRHAATRSSSTHDGDEHRRGRAADHRRVVDRRRPVPARRRRREPPAAARAKCAMDAGTAARARVRRSATRCASCCAARRRGSRSSASSGSATATDFGAITFAAFDLRDRAGGVRAPARHSTRVYVQTRSGRVRRASLQERLEQSLGPALRGARPRSQATDSRSASRCAPFLGFFTYALLGFAAIGVVVGAFVIFNTFTILVTQRTRELGLLRAMGATGGHRWCGRWCSRRFVVGVVASVFGLLRGHRPRDRACSSCCASSASTCPRRRRCCSRGRSSCRSWSACSSPSSPRCCRRCGRPGCRRSPRSTTCPSRARRAASGVGSSPGWSFVAVGVVASSSTASCGRANVTGLFDQVQVVALGAFGVLVGVVDAPRRRWRGPRSRHDRLRRSAASGRRGVARAGQRDAEPASHRGHRVGARDRARARRPHRHVRRVGEGVGRAATPATGSAPTTW